VFGWTREALLLPLEPGSTVIAFSSGAVLAGSPLSGGYAGAKATVKYIAGYAADEAERAGLGLRFCAVLPQLTRPPAWAPRRSPPTPSAAGCPWTSSWPGAARR
jgi:hypothetical protein